MIVSSTTGRTAVSHQRQIPPPQGLNSTARLVRLVQRGNRRTGLIKDR